MAALLGIEGQGSVLWVQTAGAHDASAAGDVVIHGDEGGQKVAGLAAGLHFIGDDGSQGRHFSAAGRADGVSHLQVVLGSGMAGFPGLHRTQDGQVVQLFRQAGEQRVGQLHRPALDGPHVEVRRRVGPLLEVEGVDLAGSAVQKEKDAVVGATPGGHSSGRSHVERVHHG